MNKDQFEVPEKKLRGKPIPSPDMAREEPAVRQRVQAWIAAKRLTGQLSQEDANTLLHTVEQNRGMSEEDLINTYGYEVCMCKKG